jgi:hypothetical protein
VSFGSCSVMLIGGGLITLEVGGEFVSSSAWRLGGCVRPMPGPPAAMLVALGLLECTMRPVAPAVLIVLVVWRGCVYPFYHEVFHFSFLFLGAFVLDVELV